MSDTKSASSERCAYLTRHILQAAERKAKQSAVGQDPEAGSPPQQSAETEALIALAADELARKRARARHLPSTLCADSGWTILLDLLVSEHTGGCLRVSDSEKQWNIGPETALRQIAGLIAYGLVERMPSSTASAAGAVPSVTLTAQGRRALRNAFDLS